MSKTSNDCEKLNQAPATDATSAHKPELATAGAADNESSKVQVKPVEKDKKGEVDLFWLNKVYQDPTAIFSYTCPTPSELTADCAYVLDTNVLLSPYEVGTESVKSLTTIYKELAAKNRIFTVAQAVREYAKNRSSKLSDAYSQVHSRHSSLPSANPPHAAMLEGLAEYREVQEIAAEIDEKAKVYGKKLAALKSLLQDWGWNDEVTNLYREVFTKDRIVDHKLSHAEVKAMLEWRYLHKVAPGYKDGGKLDEGVGDLLVWLSVLELGRQTQKNIVLVCNEKKSDWVVRSQKTALIPKPELRHEYTHETGKHFMLMDWARFLEAVKAPDKTVKEAERVQAVAERGLTFWGEVSDRLQSIVVIFKAFDDEWGGDSEETSYGGGDYISDKSLRYLSQRFDSTALDLMCRFPSSPATPLLQQMATLLDKILEVNGNIQQYVAREDTATHETAILLEMCRRFLKLAYRFYQWTQNQEL